jgi:REP element-mobilizing transposase RayT
MGNMTKTVSGSYPTRKSIRLKKYDYSLPGYYFITICAEKRQHLFGSFVGADSISARPSDFVQSGNSDFPINIVVKDPSDNDHKITLNDAGKMIEKVWEGLPSHFNDIELDCFVVMPNHVHGIVSIFERADMESAPTKLSGLVQTFKRQTTIEYIKMVKQNILPAFENRIWQKNYWERVLRNEGELNSAREYIQNNPQSWLNDCFYKINEMSMADLYGVEFSGEIT